MASRGCARIDAALRRAIERRIEEIGAERGQRAVALEVARREELGDRHVEADGDEAGRGDEHAHVARRALPALAGPIDVPAPVHPHVRAEDEIAGERHQQMLAARRDRLDRPAGDRTIVIDARQRGEGRVEPGDDLAGERALQRPRRAKDRVAFRHISMLLSRQSPRRGL